MATTFLIWQPPSLYGNHLPYMVTTFLIRQDLLVAERASTWAQCVGWARRKYESYFVSRIAQLLATFPADSTTSNGVPFWSPPKARQAPPIHYT